MNPADEAREQDYQQSMAFVMSQPQGRAFVWEILTRCRVFGASFTGDALTTAFNEGRRDIGIRTLNDVLAETPLAFEIMRAENEAREARYHVMPQSKQSEGMDL